MCDYKPLLFVLPHKLFFFPACLFKLDKKALCGGSSANIMQFCLFSKMYCLTIYDIDIL